MSENTQKEMEQTVQEEIAQETPVEETVAEETAQQEEKKEKKSFLKKDPKKEKIAELEKKVAELENQVAKDKDDYIRLMAEFDNFRRRTSQEKLELVSVASMDTIKGLLPVLDDCERAMAVLKESADSEAAKEGTALIYHKLLAYLQSKGLAVIDAAGKEFDTDLHEAVAQFPVQEEDKKGKVFDVVQTGYTLNGKVIRFAKVVVGI
ncbi:MAG: nucleotide exchange factor GrpE [Bacteroidales bacterium]|nr:nucleotide exchange factor GrpE [Bacteroidales bacterium]